MHRRLLTTALAVLLVLPAAASAATRHVIRGAGFGHGIGMSQYGAKGLAEHGRSYREILTHYYRGTEIVGSGTGTIRVLLQSGRGEIRFTGATRAPNAELDPGRTYTARAYGLSQLELRTAGGELVDRFDTPLTVSSSSGIVQLLGTTINGIRDGRYRDRLEIRPGVFGGLGAVNALSLDEYVKGVVPGEVPAAWHTEALKAQALAARTYALTTDKGGEVFDQYPDTRSQVYRGANGEHPRTNEAVDATAGEIVTYAGQPIPTFYFSTSGGRTESVENVFYNSPPRPYLVSVEDPYDGASPKHRWRFTFTSAQMRAKLAGLVKGRFRRIRVVQRGVSPRVVWADVIGSRGRTRVRGATLRARLGLYDTWAYFTTISTQSARAALGSSWLARLIAPRALTGSVVPRPRGRRIVVERRTRRGWRRERRVRAARDGGYHVVLRSPGTYRVRAGAAAGPAVRVG
jgi:stage II sporulation protein D